VPDCIDVVSLAPTLVASSADPAALGRGLAWLTGSFPAASARLEADGALAQTVATVLAASAFLTRVCATDPLALDVLSDLDRIAPPALLSEGAAGIARWKRLELLRIAARDLSDQDELEAITGALSRVADAVVEAGVALSGVGGTLAVIGMGKLGAQELNYGSDIDVIFVGEGDARELLDILRQAWRTDTALRPEGRAGPLVRTLGSYEAYWDRWAATWEFQALIKARAVAGPPELGRRFEEAAGERVWGRPFGAEDLRSVRELKARAEGEVVRKGLGERELKLGRGGIRDIEFAVQLLQLVHGRADPALRAPATLNALAAMAAGGYVDPADAAVLAEAYRFFRTVEHRLQLFDDQQVHALPIGDDARVKLARVLGFRDGRQTTARSRFESELRRHQVAVRSVHERLFFRPLLEAFTQRPALEGTAGPGALATAAGAAVGAGAGAGAGPGPGLSSAAASERLAAFGFADASRTRSAVQELTRGFSRGSRLMQQLLPLTFEWLSEAPDPELGLLGLRSLTTGAHRRGQLTALFRESPEAARRLCRLLGTSPLFARGFERQPDQLTLLAEGFPAPPARPELLERARASTGWRPGTDWRQGLVAFQRGEVLRIAARDVLGLADTEETGRSLTELAEAIVLAALDQVADGLPLSIVALGRFGGQELAYASDLDVIVVYDGAAVAAAEAATERLLRAVKGDTPATRLYTLDLSLRPEGRQGLLARSLGAYALYYERWAQTWERQALVRARWIGGDEEVGRRFGQLTDAFVWDRPLTTEDEREIRRLKARIERERIPPGEDPAFHLKFGRGSLTDVEWTVQLLQLRRGAGTGVPAGPGPAASPAGRSPGTLAALRQLVTAKAISAGDAAVLESSYHYCETARNRLYLVRGHPGDALPAAGHQLTTLARSLGTTAPELRDEYRRRTRRARKVMERLFYGA
jgi:glutamate-ammonia-ligase adenylyltransferase